MSDQGQGAQGQVEPGRGKPERALRVAIVGAGLIGQGWAVVFARSGHTVCLHDPAKGVAEVAREAVLARLRELAGRALVLKESIADAQARISVAATLEEAVAEADYVQENGPEDPGIKAELTARIDAAARPGVPIGSSTSGIPASVYGAAVAGRDRCLVVHPVNPPHLVPAVEIVPAPWTDPAVTEWVRSLMRQVGQAPIMLDREIDGFVVNRLQGALLAEAFRLLEEGVAAPEDVDTAIRDGLGLRWSFMGPFETIHLNAPEGVAQYVERYGPMYDAMFGTSGWEGVLEQGLRGAMEALHPLDRIPDAQEARDEALMALLRHRKTPGAGMKRNDD